MGRTDSFASGYAPKDDGHFDPRIDDFVPKERKYTHFDFRLSEAERENFTSSEQLIEQRSFWPLLGFEKKERRVKKTEGGDVTFKEKTREIKFGSHGDAATMGWYANQLAVSYEKLLFEKKIGMNVLAYRKGLGSNIDQAHELFKEIEGNQSCIAIAMDVKGFFDNLNHGIMLEQLRSLEQSQRLNEAAFKIYRRMTKFEWVDADKLRLRLGDIYGRFGRICSAKEFREIVRGRIPNLVNINSDGYGIPQGTPLSGLYANIYMIEFDCLMATHLSELGGSYRRYSDDIAIILPASGDLKKLIDFVSNQIKELRLEINPSKTEVSYFQTLSGTQTADRPFQYLGFTFDGQQTLLRASSIKRYYSKMRKGIFGKVTAAFKKGVSQDEIYMRHLFKKYTHYGKNRNFPRYAYRASETMNAPEVRAQLRNHMNVFSKTIDEAVTEVYG